MKNQQHSADRTSARIVDFIGKLIPIYYSELWENRLCARSLCNGTLLLPIDEPFEDQNGLIKVHWQGDASRSSVVQGVFLAQLAIYQYAQLHTVHRPHALVGELTHLSSHFEVKTGVSLAMDLDDEKSARQLVADLTKRLGVQAIIEIAKKSAGV